MLLKGGKYMNNNEGCENYVIKSGHDKVELWSQKRLPFEPKDWLQQMKNDLCAELRRITAKENTILFAEYASPDESPCDVENVLLYNVGSGPFRHLTRSGIFLKRNFQAKPLHETSPRLFPHYHRYQMYSLDLIHEEMAKTQNLLASWNNIMITFMTSNAKPHQYWYALKTHDVVIYRLRVPLYYGIHLQIDAPNKQYFNLASIIKPMLDGFISAFHSYHKFDSEIINKLTMLAGSQRDTIVSLVQNQNTAILGKREFVRRYREGVQWNPNDERCVQISVLVQRHTLLDTCKVSGKVFEVKR